MKRLINCQRCGGLTVRTHARGFLCEDCYDTVVGEDDE